MSNKTARTLDELNLLDNFLFETMISYPEIGESFSRYLLETILQRKIRRLSITGQKSVPGKDTIFHGIRMDVEIRETAEDGEADGEVGFVCDIEPEQKKSKRKELPKRTRYYHSLMDSRMLGTGKDYDSLADVYVIVITNFDPFGENRMVYTMKTGCVEDPKLPYEDGSRTIYLYTKGEAGSPPQELRELLRYMETTSLENAVNSSLRTINEMVEAVRKDTEVTSGYMHWEIVKRDLLEEGREEGYTLKLISLIIRKMQKSRSPEQIAEELEEDLDVIQPIYDKARLFAPEYDTDKIYEAFKSGESKIRTDKK